ncbi:hypothetical protein ACLOJK_031863 [Asimina triloba]
MWNATWLASGTCSGGNETVFFETGLDIAKQANVLGGLRQASLSNNAGIVPSDTKKYRYDKVCKALQKSVGKNVVITCNKNHDGKSQIYSVHVCANKEGSALIDCPHTDFSCPNKLCSLSSPQTCSSTLLPMPFTWKWFSKYILLLVLFSKLN